MNMIFCSNIYPTGPPQEMAQLFYAIAMALENGWTEGSTPEGDWWLEEDEDN